MTVVEFQSAAKYNSQKLPHKLNPLKVCYNEISIVIVI